MNNTFKNILLILLLIVSGLLIWYFFKIILYIIISAILALVGKPVVEVLQKFRIGRFRLSDGISAFITLMLLIVAFVAFASFIVPLVVYQAAFISELDVATITKSLEDPLFKVELFMKEWSILGAEEKLGNRIIHELIAIATFEKFSTIFSSLINLTVEVFFGFLAISFITFFFLKERGLFSKIVLLFTPTRYRPEAIEILSESKVLLRRYFIGLFSDLAAVFILISLAMWIIGLPNALVIGFFAGILNIIPYVGPIIATFIGVFLGISVNLHLDFYTQILPMIVSITAAFIIVNTIDVGVLQPMIYSKSVKTHPLEIFIVFMMAGMMAGVFGMIVAIPVYSVIRIFARQVLMKSRLVQNLRYSINNSD
jgi:predicted PurR-regulated permease PerM